MTDKTNPKTLITLYLNIQFYLVKANQQYSKIGINQTKNQVDIFIFFDLYFFRDSDNRRIIGHQGSIPDS